VALKIIHRYVQALDGVHDQPVTDGEYRRDE
jgi:hypothetical protein